MPQTKEGSKQFDLTATNQEQPMSICLAPINPFTPIQREVLSLWIIDGLSYKEMARKLHRPQAIIRDIISGNRVYDNSNTDLTSFSSRRSSLGILGIIEIITGKRPTGSIEVLRALWGDVIIDNTASDYYRALNRGPKSDVALPTSLNNF